MGFAPALIRFDQILDGWYMVVMDAIDQDYENLHQTPHETLVLNGIKEKIGSLHQAGYVHGNIHNTNVMVWKDGVKGLILIGQGKLGWSNI